MRKPGSQEILKRNPGFLVSWFPHEKLFGGSFAANSKPRMSHLHFANLFGWVAMLLLAWGISYNRKNFPWRTVIWGLGLQLTLAILVLDTPWGAKLFEFAGKVVQKLIQF